MVLSESAAASGPAATPVARSRTYSLAQIIRFAIVAIAGGLLVGSMFMPYWTITLHAPQYPRGLYIDVYVNKMEPVRNVFEVDNLNHYIGMIRLTDAAPIERKISLYAIPAIALIALASFLVRGVWRWLLRFPVILYPAIFVGDLFGWLYYAGNWLDPHAPMSSSIKEFTPRIYGKGTIGQFRTEAHFLNGFYLTVIAALLVLAVTIWERSRRNATRD